MTVKIERRNPEYNPVARVKATGTGDGQPAEISASQSYAASILFRISPENGRFVYVRLSSEDAKAFAWAILEMEGGE